MKKGGIILGSITLAMLMGYGAWCLYDKMYPDEAKKVKKDMKKALKNLEDIPDDMM